jgi:hypothetical protein
VDDKFSELRNRWWELHQANNIQSAIELDPSTKLEFLKMIYQGLYAELQSIHSSQQQIVGWGFAILSGGGFLISIGSDQLSWIVVILLIAILGGLTYVATSTIRFLSEDRMSIARQLDRIHQVAQTFKTDVYVRETTLFDPIWHGWGFEPKNDVNWKLARSYQVVLWLIFAIDVALLVNSLGLS